MEVRYNLVIDFARPSKSNTIIISEGDHNSRLLHFILLNNKQPMNMSDIAPESITVKGIRKDGTTTSISGADIVYDEKGTALNEIEFLIPEDYTKVSGEITMTVSMVSETNQKITSFEFYLHVRNALYSEDDLVSEEDLMKFSELYNKTAIALKRMESLMGNNALANPKPLMLEVEDAEYIYYGDETVQVKIKDMAYLSDDPVIVVDPIDQTSAKTASEAAEEAREYAEQAHTSEVNVTKSEENIAGIAAQIAAEKDDIYFKVEEGKSYVQTSIDNGLVSEGFAKGTQNGVPVGEGSPYFENNAEYFSSRLSVEDRLDSADKNKSLSANQGRVLNDIKADRSELEQIQTSVDGMGTMVNALSLTVGEIESNYYPKPESGIPYTDLEEGVRDILDETAEIPAIKEDINGVIEDLTQIYNGGFASKNLVDISQFAKKYPEKCIYANGELSATTFTELYTTGLDVDIPSGSYFSFYGKLGTATNVRLRFVHADGSVGDAQVTSVTTTNYEYKVFKATKAIKGIRFNWTSVGTFFIKDFMVNTGDEAIAYMPYAKSNVELSESIEMISDAWNNTKTYAVGDYCIYNNSLWKCKVQNSNSAPSENANWTKVNVASELQGETVTLDSNINIVKVGKIVSISWALNNNYLSDDGKTLNFKIPQGFRPKTNLVFTSKVYNGAYIDCHVRVLYDGTVDIAHLTNMAIQNVNIAFLQDLAITYPI